MSDAECAERLAAYQAHTEAVLPLLPSGLRAIAGEAGDERRRDLHDGRVKAWDADLPDRLVLEIVAGDRQRGYERLTLGYEGCELVGASEDDLARWFADERTELLYDEVDVLYDGRFEHRHLLWPAGELTVRFCDFSLTATPAVAEEYATASQLAARDRGPDAVVDVIVEATTAMEFVAALVGEVVLWHITDPISGAMLDLGERRTHDWPVRNRKLTEEQRHYHGAKGVFIQCTWNISGPTELLPQSALASSLEKWNQEMDLFVGAQITDASLNPSTRALRLDFDNELSLHASPRGEDDYTIRLYESYLTVPASGDFGLQRPGTNSSEATKDSTS